MLYTFFIIIFGVFIGQEFNVPNIRDTYLFLSNKIIEYQQDRRVFSDNEEESIWTQMLNKIKQNLNLNN